MRTISEFEALLSLRLDSYPLAVPPLSNEGATYDLCDGTQSLRRMLPSLDAAAFAKVLPWIIWLDEPLLARSVAGAERCLIFSAEPEQTFLSIAGYLLNRSGRIDCLNVVCFSPTSEGTNRALTTFNEVLAARCDDANLCARAVGISNVFLDLPGHAVRQLTAMGPDRITHEKSIRATLSALMYRLIETHSPKHVFAPAALGNRPDEALLFNAALRIFENGYFRRTRYHLFEIFPEAEAHIEIDSFLSSFENAYVRTNTWFDDVSGVERRKLQLLGMIRATPAARLGPLVTSVAVRNATLARQQGRAAERFWELGLTFGSD